MQDDARCTQYQTKQYPLLQCHFPAALSSVRFSRPHKIVGVAIILRNFIASIFYYLI